MGTSWRESNQNYVTIKQQSSNGSIQSKLSLKTSDQVKEQLICVQEVDSKVGKWSIFDEGQFCFKF